MYGDVNSDGNVDLDDVVCVLDGFARNYRCAFRQIDIHPCEGDGVIDLSDVSAVLESFVGNYQCEDPCEPCVGNITPVSNAGADRSVPSGQSLSFTGGSSLDYDGRIVEYSWNFGDGDYEIGDSVTHVFPQAGIYTVTLTVLDDCGSQHSDSAVVTVTGGTPSCSNNQSPVANAGPDQLGDVGVPVAFNGSSSSDPDGQVTAWWWRFGDGYSTGWQSSPIVQHVYESPATYQVRLWVRDNCGRMSAGDGDLALVTIRGGACNSNQPPVADAGPSQSNEAGLPVSFDGGASSDSDGSIAAYNWSFGDGQTGTGPTTSHTYDNEGNYTVTLTVTDNCGATHSHSTSATISSSSYVDLDPQLEGFVEGRVGAVHSVAISPNGQRLYVSSEEFTVLEFDITNQTARPTFLRSATNMFGAKGVLTNGSALMIGDAGSAAKVTSLNTLGTANEQWFTFDFVAQAMVFRNNWAYVAAGPSGLKVYDVTNPLSPQLRAQVALPAVRGVAVSPNGRWVYVASGSNGTAGLFQVVDLLNPASPVVQPAITTGAYGITGEMALDATGRYAYVTDYGAGIAVIDLVNPTAPTPQFVRSLSTADPAGDITRVGNLLLVTTAVGWGRMHVYNIGSNPSNPTSLGSLSGAFLDVAAQGDFAYLAANRSGVVVGDMRNPNQPVELSGSRLDGDFATRNACASNGVLALVGGSSTNTRVLNVSNPAAPVQVGTIAVTVQDIAMQGNYAYLATGSTGLQVVNLTQPSGVLATTVPMFARGVTLTSNGRWAFVAGRVTVGANTFNGLNVVDLINPSTPVARASLQLDQLGFATDVALNDAGTVAVVADYGAGVHFVNVANPLAPQLLASLTTNAPATRVAVLGEYALVVKPTAYSGSLQVVDMSNPSSPTVVKSVNGLFESIDVFEHYAVLASQGLGVSVLDLFDPEGDVPVTMVPSPGRVYSSHVFGNRVYLGNEAALLSVVSLLEN